MELDYDIYSYIAKGIGKGDLVPKVVSEKVTYEIVGFEKIDFDKSKKVMTSDSHDFFFIHLI